MFFFELLVGTLRIACYHTWRRTTWECLPWLTTDSLCAERAYQGEGNLEVCFEKGLQPALVGGCPHFTLRNSWDQENPSDLEEPIQAIWHRWNQSPFGKKRSCCWEGEKQAVSLLCSAGSFALSWSCWLRIHALWTALSLVTNWDRVLAPRLAIKLKMSQPWKLRNFLTLQLQLLWSWGSSLDGRAWGQLKSQEESGSYCPGLLLSSCSEKQAGSGEEGPWGQSGNGGRFLDSVHKLSGKGYSVDNDTWTKILKRLQGITLKKRVLCNTLFSQPPHMNSHPCMKASEPMYTSGFMPELVQLFSPEDG